MSQSCPNCGVALHAAIVLAEAPEPTRKQIIYAGPFDVEEAEVLPVIGLSDRGYRNFDIDGQRSRFVVPGQKQYGIFESGSDRITYEDFSVKSVTGDGAQIGCMIPRTGGEVIGPSTNGIMQRGVISDVGRNGLAVTGASNWVFRDLVIGKVTGNDPGAQVDLEPDENEIGVDRVQLINIRGSGKRVGLICDYSPDRPARAPVTNITIQGGEYAADDPDGWSGWLRFPYVEGSVNLIQGATFRGPLVHLANVILKECTLIRDPLHPIYTGHIASQHENVQLIDIIYQ